MSNIKHAASCADDYDPTSLPLAVAKQYILNTVVPLTDTVELELQHALGYVSGEDIQSEVDVPPHTNSAMDGYALRFEDMDGQDSVALKVVGQSLAGHPYTSEVKGGQCVRIMTGGVMPNGSDTVVMQEHAVRKGDIVKIGKGHKRGQNVRKAGEDITRGNTIISRGTQLSPAHLGLLASTGVAKVRTVRRLKVCMFSTGDELRPVGSTLGVGQLYDSNRYSLKGMLQRLNAEITDLGVIKDDEVLLTEAFEKSADGHDAVVTSGGVSVGEADFTKNVFANLGQIDFWKIAVKPGRPFAFGKLGDAIYFGLPGNPVSVVATFYMLVQPALKKMMAMEHIEPMMVHACCTTPLRKRRGRAEIQRGIAEADAYGKITVQSTGAQGSGILSSVTNANCFIFLDSEVESVAVGESVNIIPFAELV